MKQKISWVLLVIILLCMPAWGVAATQNTWNIADGPVYIHVSADGQTVEQNSVVTKANNPVVMGTSASNHIEISSDSGYTAKMTIKDLVITLNGNGSAIDVGEEAAIITVVGENTLTTQKDAAVHVAAGGLTIAGDGTLNAQCTGNASGDECGAAIGSNISEAMSGSITICGSVAVKAKNMSEDALGNDTWNASAAIGSGYNGAMSGKIVIEGNANVEALCEDENGAGIGSGENGAMSGSIIIRGNAIVVAEGEDDGAGIGSGEDGEMSGMIHITDHAGVKAKSGDRGAGIGSGEDASVSGTIQIDGYATVDAESDDDNAAGIGGGKDGKITASGSIIIGGHAVVVASGEDAGTGIGAGEDKIMAGSITIKEYATVTAYAGSSAAAIGADNKDEMTGTISILDYANVTTWVTTSDGTRSEEEHGYIGGSSDSYASSKGMFVISSGAVINGVPGNDTENLKPFINADFEKNVIFVEPSFEREMGAVDLPQTGDESRVALWMILLMLSSVGAMYLCRRENA